jgi:hypothetical protein
LTDPRIERLERHLEDRRSELATAVAAVPAARRGVVPRAGGWSVAMLLEHLAQTERAVAGLLSKLLANAGSRGDETFDATAFERHIDMPAFLDRTRKLKLAQPSGSLTADEAWTTLEQTRAELLGVLRRAEGRRLETTSFEHPSGRSLDGYQWIAFVGLHEARHAAQIREIQERLEGRE